MNGMINLKNNMQFEQVEVNSERWFDLNLLLNEKFKDIKCYENFYQVSNYGRIKRKEKISEIESINQFKHYSCNRKNKEKILKCINVGGYYKVGLSNNEQRKIYSVHRLVAEAFIPNPNNYPVINHKDENPKNNNVYNLEYCTIEYNNKYGKRILKASESIKKSVIQYDVNGNIIKEWKSLSNASKSLNINHGSISSCCRNKLKTAGGFVWKYKGVEING